MKKLLATILALVMALGLCSVSWAETTANCTGSCEHEAAINGTHYDKLQEAVNAANAGDTITLLRNITDGDGVIVTSGKNIIFNFDGFTYEINGKLVGSSGSETNGFQLLKGSTVTMNNGTIIAGNNSTGKASNGTWAGSAAILIQNYSTLTLNGMKLTGGNRTYYTLSNNNGETVINDSTITAGNGGSKIAFDVYGNFGDYDDVKVTVKGKSIINGDVEIDRDSKIPDTQNANTLIVDSGTFKNELKVTKGVVSVSGGTFSKPLPKNYLAESVNYEVSNSDSVSYFANIDDAVAAAGGEGQVTNVKEEEGGTGGHTVILTDNGSVVANLYTAATSVNLPTLSKSGYTFKGWKDNGGKVHTGTFTLPSQAVTDSFYLTAVWSANSYYYYPSTSDTTTSTTTKGSPKTFDAGVGIYAVTALLSVTGMAWAGKKRH